jgi:diguanylate cyclase (GGDEF)-like protein/PAS domain S-box-containing protein
MNMEHVDIADKMFSVFASMSKSRYIFWRNLKTSESRWSKNAVEFFGMSGEYMMNADVEWEQHLHPEDRKRYRAELDAILSGEKRAMDLEFRAKDKNGNYVMCSCKGEIIEGEEGEPLYFAGIIANHGIIENIDPVTNLYNQYAFLQKQKALRENKKASIALLIGIKHFSDVNDVYGYSFGNFVLKELGVKLQELLQDQGNVYRMDGTRFAVISDTLLLEEVKHLYKELQYIARYQINVQNTHISVAVCGGAVLVDDFSIDEHTVHASGNFALDKSKNEKHGELVIVKDDYLNDNKKTVELISVMRDCILDGCDGFYMCYQPVVSSGDGKLTGMEALLRWNKEPYGNVPPGVFVPWLEKDAVFFELGNWILHQAMVDGNEFLKKHPKFLMHVNISYTQLERSEFRNCLMSMLKETGFPPENLCLELTERCRFLDMSFLQHEVLFLKSQGIKIALDDFGTGFSSLNLLRELPVDCIKIDRGFVSEIETNPTDQSIVKAVTQCAKELSILVCVEGIENAQLESYMKNYPATNYQGYYYSRPVPFEEFKRLSIY